MLTNINESIQDYLDAFNNNKEVRLEKIADLLHLLNFEKRLTELTDEESQAMINAGRMSDDLQRYIDACDTEEQRDKLIKSQARSQYFVQCAWSDYLNGVSEFKPVDSKRQAQRMWGILKDE